MNSDHVATIRDLLEAAIAGTESTIRTRNYHGLRAFATSEEEWLSRYRAALTALEEAAGWEPVGEKFILTHNTGLVDHPKLFVRWNADDESIIVGTDDGSFHHCPLPDHIRLFRKRQPARQGDA